MKNSTQKNIDALKMVLGQTFRLYVQTHGYHWNVEGPQFYQLHAMFEEQYNNLCQSLDEIAERIRIQGAHAPGSVAELMALAGPEAPKAANAEEMMTAIIEAHDALADVLRTAIATAQECGDEVSAGLLTDRLDWHEKELWMMEASRV